MIGEKSLRIFLECTLAIAAASCGRLPSSPTLTVPEPLASSVVPTPTLPSTPPPPAPADTPPPALPRLRELRSFERRGLVVSYAPDGGSIAVMPGLPPIELISSLSGDTAATFEVLPGSSGEGGTQALAFSPDGEALAIGGREARVELWRLQDGILVASVELSTLFDYDPVDWFASVSDLAFLDQRTLLVTSWEDTGGLAVWDPTSGSYAKVFGKPVVDMAPLPEANLVALATRPVGIFVETDAPVVVYDLNARRISFALFEDDPASRPRGAYPPSAYSVSVSPDGHFLAAVVEDQLRIWDLAENQEVAFPAAQGVGFHQVRFSSTGRLAVVSSTRGNCVNWIWATDNAPCALSIWDTVRWVALAQVDAPGLTAIDFSPDGAQLASGGMERVIHIWEVP